MLKKTTCGFSLKISHCLAFVALITLISLRTNAGAEMYPVLKNRAGIPPFDIIKEILQSGKDTKKSPPPPTGTYTTPYLVWVADTDARIQPQYILTHPEQKIYSVRNLANQLDTSLGAIDYGVLYLRSPILLITGNTDNESLRLFAGNYGELNQSIRLELDHLYPALGSPGKDAKKTQKETELHLVEQNVDYQVRQALERYSERVEKKRLVVVGSVLDITNAYGKGMNQLIIININGETDGEKIRKMQMLRSVNPKLLANIGRPAVSDMKKLKTQDTF